jgi:hypothetical protein
MKFKNLQQCTDLCARIEKLKNKLDLIQQDRPLVMVISHNWDTSLAIIREWDSTEASIDKEDGLYVDILVECKLEIISRIKERIDFLEFELSKL